MHVKIVVDAAMITLAIGAAVALIIVANKVKDKDAGSAIGGMFHSSKNSLVH